MDEFSIGSSGFAQVGQPYYNEKQRIEKKVLFEYVLKKTVFPTEFLNLAFFKWKANSHDFGTYHDLVIMAHSSIRDMEDSEDPEEVVVG